MLERMIGAARLRVATYQEVVEDPRAAVQALLVVVLTSVATAAGTLGAAGGDTVSFGFGILFGLLTWVSWAFLTYVVGATLFGTREGSATWGRVAKATAFAQSPAILRVFGVIPVVGGMLGFVISLWQFAAMIVAVRGALGYRSTWRSAGVVAPGFFSLLMLQILLLSV